MSSDAAGNGAAGLFASVSPASDRRTDDGDPDHKTSVTLLAEGQSRLSASALSALDSSSDDTLSRRDSAVNPSVRAQQHGTLVIHIKRAQNLVAKDRNGLSDPYVVIAVHGKRRFRSAIKYATLNPVWDQFGEYTGQLAQFLKSPLILKVYDYDRFDFNDPLGECTVDLTPLLERNKLSANAVPLQKVKHGTLDVAVHFEQTAVNFAFPSPVAASALEAINEAVIDVPADAHWIERQRDGMLKFLATHKFFEYATIVWIVCVVVWVILLVLLLPMQLGWVAWDAGVYGFNEADAQTAWVVCNTVLCSLFTWKNALSFPWRVACAIHLLPCYKRCADPGLDFYGRETESMFFHIPTRHRAVIVGFLNGAVLLQFTQQIVRGFYTTYQASEKEQPGQALILSSFVGGILFDIAGGIYQFVQLFYLHQEYPERFPPSAAITSIIHFSHVWKHGGGNICQIMRGAIVEFKEQTEKFQERRRSLAMGLPGASAFDKGKYGTDASPAAEKNGEDDVEGACSSADEEPPSAISPPLVKRPSLVEQMGAELRRKQSREGGSTSKGSSKKELYESAAGEGPVADKVYDKV